MRRPLHTLFLFASFGLFGSAAACSGAIQPESGPSPSNEAGAPSVRPDSGTTDEDAAAPLRDVTAPVEVDLGAVAGGQEVSFTVPAGALGFNIVLQATSASQAEIGIERITSPSGEVVHASFTPKGGNHATSHSGFDTIASASVPQSEAKAANPPEPGVWKVRFFAGGAIDPPPPPPPPLDAGLDDAGGTDGGASGIASMKARVRIQMGATAGFVGGRLDLRVYVPKGLRLDGATLDATSAAANAGIERRLDTFFKALAAQVGIDRGEVTFHGAEARLSFIDDEQSLLDGFRVSKSRPDGEQALHVLLTNGIDFGDGGGAWGIAPGIPGAATRTGTSMSGIILAIDDTPPVGDGLTMLHEAGHFFGLNHTTELYGDYADPLADTPKCTTISFDDPSSLRGCPDKMNVMFPAFYGTAGSAIEVSEAQRRVYRGSPLYKAYARPLEGTMAGRTSTGSANGAGAAGAPTFLRPGERITLTKSGRALSPTETWLSAGLCSHVKLDGAAFARRHGREAALAELRAAAGSADLPAVVRRKAAAALRTIE